MNKVKDLTSIAGDLLPEYPDRKNHPKSTLVL